MSHLHDAVAGLPELATRENAPHPGRAAAARGTVEEGALLTGNPGTVARASVALAVDAVSGTLAHRGDVDLEM